MMKKINKNILSLPPHISTSWDKVASLHLEQSSIGPILNINLMNGNIAEVPGLTPEEIDEIFLFHTQVMEEESLLIQQQRMPFSPFATPPAGMDSSIVTTPSGVMRHNAQQSGIDDLPAEIIEKLIKMTRTLGINVFEAFASPQLDCNCIHCQIARSLARCDHSPDHPSADCMPVSDEDLTFREWDVIAESDKLFVVSNPLDHMESYKVFLGSPIGCTCGENNCAHVRAVLST